MEEHAVNLMKMLDDSSLNPEQRQLLAAILNREGNGNHTSVTAETLRSFSRDYVVRCLERALGKASASVHERVAALWASI